MIQTLQIVQFTYQSGAIKACSQHKVAEAKQFFFVWKLKNKQ
jgi:hypothetical protein